jgi:hypothetical protein
MLINARTYEMLLLCGGSLLHPPLYFRKVPQSNSQQERSTYHVPRTVRSTGGSNVSYRYFRTFVLSYLAGAICDTKISPTATSTDMRVQNGSPFKGLAG